MTGVRMHVGANSEKRHRVRLGWKMTSSVWHLLILKVTMEMSARQVHIEFSGSNSIFRTEGKDAAFTTHREEHADVLRKGS